MITIRPITKEDVYYFYGKECHDKFLGKTIELDGKPVCIAGVVFRDDTVIAFSENDKTVKVPKRTIWRYAKELKEYIMSLGYPAVAYADEETPRSEKFLESLGFKKIAEKTYHI